MILSVSCINNGINLNAIPIIIEHSCEGNPIFDNGLNKESNPSASSRGAVVNGRITAKSINTNNLADVKNAL